jgi:hypothetical protein
MTTSAGVIVLPSSSIARAPRSSGNAVPRGAQRIGGRLAKHLMQHRCRSCLHYARVGDIVADGSNRCLYFEGVSRSPGTDPLFLQIKDEPPSAYASFLPKSTVCHSKQAHRVVDGQRAMQLTSDPLLGFTTMDGRYFWYGALRSFRSRYLQILSRLRGQDGERLGQR